MCMPTGFGENHARFEEESNVRAADSAGARCGFRTKDIKTADLDPHTHGDQRAARIVCVAAHRSSSPATPPLPRDGNRLAKGLEPKKERAMPSPSPPTPADRERSPLFLSPKWLRAQMPPSKKARAARTSAMNTREPEGKLRYASGHAPRRKRFAAPPSKRRPSCSRTSPASSEIILWSDIVCPLQGACVSARSAPASRLLA